MNEKQSNELIGNQTGWLAIDQSSKQSIDWGVWCCPVRGSVPTRARAERPQRVLPAPAQPRADQQFGSGPWWGVFWGSKLNNTPVLRLGSQAEYCGHSACYFVHAWGVFRVVPACARFASAGGSVPGGFRMAPVCAFLGCPAVAFLRFLRGRWGRPFSGVVCDG